jgi:hypothetical protein
VTETLRVRRREVRITHPERVVFPRARLTKLDLARHYERVAPMMLVHVRDRPLALQAFPGGIEEPGYFMKAVPGYFPDWIGRQEGRHDHPRRRSGRRDARLSRGPERAHHARVALARGSAAPTGSPDRGPRSLGWWLRRGPRCRACRRRAIARSRPGPVRDDHRLARRARRLPAAPGCELSGSSQVRARTRRGDGRRGPPASDASMAKGRSRQADLPRRQPDRVRTARGRALRGSTAAARAGGGAAALGRAVGTAH